MSHIVQVDFQRRRMVAQEVTLHNFVPHPRGPISKRPAKNCICGCGQPVRSTNEIMRDLAPLRMTGPEDDELRKDLIEELRHASEPLDWNNGPTGGAA